MGGRGGRRKGKGREGREGKGEGGERHKCCPPTSEGWRRHCSQVLELSNKAQAFVARVLGTAICRNDINIGHNHIATDVQIIENVYVLVNDRQMVGRTDGPIIW